MHLEADEHERGRDRPRQDVGDQVELLPGEGDDDHRGGGQKLRGASAANIPPTTAAAKKSP